MQVQKFVGWQLRGLLRSCAVQLVATVLVLSIFAGCVLLAYVLPLPSSWEDLWFVVGLASGTIICCLVSWTALLIAVLYRRQKLNSLFGRFQPNFKISFWGQHYRTPLTVAGKVINVALQRGPLLTITTDVPTQTRLTLHNTVTTEAVRWEQLTVQTSDPIWLQRWSEQEHVRSVLLSLLTLKSAQEVRTLWLTPEKMWFKLYRFPINTLTAPRAEKMVQQFITLAETAQTTTATTVPVQSNRLERFADATVDQPKRAVGWALLIIFVIMLVIAIPVMLLVLLANVISWL